MRYEIRVESVLDPDWSEWFDGLEVSHDGEETVLVASFQDHTALYGLLRKIGDLRLRLVSIRRVEQR